MFGFPFGGLGEPNIYHDFGGELQGSGDLTWRMSDCEELAGAYLQEMMGKDANKCFQKQEK